MSSPEMRTRPHAGSMPSVRVGSAAVDFYKVAFGVRELFRVDSPDGEVVADLAVGDSDFWVADEPLEHKNFSPETLGGATARMVLIVDDPDAVFAEAVAAGALEVWPVADQEYGWRVGRVVDPFGQNWEIGRPLVGLLTRNRKQFRANPMILFLRRAWRIASDLHSSAVVPSEPEDACPRA